MGKREIATSASVIVLLAFVLVLISGTYVTADELNDPFLSDVPGYIRVPAPGLNALLMDDDIIVQAYEFIYEHAPEIYGLSTDDLALFVPVDSLADAIEFCEQTGIYRIGFVCLSFENPYYDKMHFSVIISLSRKAAYFSDCPQLMEKCSIYKSINVSAEEAVEIMLHSVNEPEGEGKIIFASLHETEGKVLWHIQLCEQTAPYTYARYPEINVIVDAWINANDGTMVDLESIKPTQLDMFQGTR